MQYWTGRIALTSNVVYTKVVFLLVEVVMPKKALTTLNKLNRKTTASASLNFLEGQIHMIKEQLKTLPIMLFAYKFYML